MMNITNKPWSTNGIAYIIEAKIMAQYRPRLWSIYVDDTFVIINRNDLEHFHTIINSLNANIKFSREEEQNDQLSNSLELGGCREDVAYP